MRLLDTNSQPDHTAAHPEGLTVVIAAVAATAELSGVTRHAANLARCLLTRDDIAHVHLLIAPWQLAALEALLPDTARLHLQVASVGRGALARNLWYYRQLPALVEDLHADVLHLAYPAPLKPRSFACPTVVTLHDLYPYDIPQNFGFPKVLFNRAILQQCLRAVDSIACVSESTLRRLDMFAPSLAITKGTIVFNCVDAGPAKSAHSPIPHWSGESFLLCVAQHRRNKNISLAISTFESLHRNGELKPGAKLVIVGIPGPETAALHRQIHEAHLTHDIVLLSGLADSELEWCYAHCELVLAPSLVEGFGLPIVEAMFHHCRVVCSDIPAFREVGGSYCVFASLRFSPRDSFLDAARIALGSHRFRSGATARFSSERIAADYLRLYSRLLLSRFRSSSKHVPLPQLERGRP